MKSEDIENICFVIALAILGMLFITTLISIVGVLCIV